MIKIFCGVPGSGKSLAMQDLVRTLNAESRLGCVVIDRTCEWGVLDKDGGENVRWRRHPPLLTELSLTDNDDRIREALTECRDKGTTAVFQTADCFAVGRWVQRIGDMVYVDDEIDLTARVKDWQQNPLRAFVHTGRHLADEEGYHREVHILGACRRVQNIHTDLTEMADEAFIFRSQGMNTFKRLLAEGWCEETDVDYVRNQPNLSYQNWKNDGTLSRGFLTPLKVPKDANSE